MDGGGRLLQSIMTIGSRFRTAPADNALSGPGTAEARPISKSKSVRPGAQQARARARAYPRHGWQRALRVLTSRGAGVAMVLSLVLTTGVYGGVRSGGIERYFAEQGSVRDLVARGFGFGIAAITIRGQRALLSTEVLALAGIRKQDSLLFLDAEEVREKLVRSPVILSADVRKLYPNQLVIGIVERRADAVWQRDGEVSIVAADGSKIDKMRDQRYARLPFVVGAGANKRLKEYIDILAAAGPLKSKIRAGTLIGERRWTIKFVNGLELQLPERKPAVAMADFVDLAKKHDLLDKDLIVADMRVPGRFIGRLSAEALSRRSGSKVKKTKRKGGAA